MSPEQKLHNMVLDFLYRQICKGKTNQEIFRDMESKSLPTMTNDELEGVRLRFKDKELSHPQRMAMFRNRLGV